MVDLKKLYRRQWDIVKPSQLSFPIMVIGAGGVGSWVTLALAKMGCQDIAVVDNDVVEEKNVPSQIYTLEQVGKPKVEALREIVEMFTAVKISVSDRKFPDVSNYELLPEAVIVTVDSLQERRKIWVHFFPEGELIPDRLHAYIDVRMGGDLMKIFTINPKQLHLAQKYAKRLFNEEVKPDQQPCTARSIVYNTLFCGAIVADIVKHYALKEPVPPSFVFDLSSFRLI